MTFAVVNAFTLPNQPFTGNPAGVCLLETAAPVEWMQLVAQQVNLSETAFAIRERDLFTLRWFSPATEVALCGHATLATAHVLYGAGLAHPGTPVRFQTASGVLTATGVGDDMIDLNFPAIPDEAVAPPEGLLEALGTLAQYVGRSRFDYLVHVDSEDVVRRLKPDMAQLKTLPVRGVMVTAPSATPGVDFVSRFFAPGAGIDEDPVTGSAHCCLVPYWARRLGRTRFIARQLSSRGGELQLALEDDRVRLGGHAVTMFRGDWLAW